MQSHGSQSQKCTNALKYLDTQNKQQRDLVKIL